MAEDEDVEFIRLAVYGYVWNIEKYSHNRKRASKGIK